MKYKMKRNIREYIESLFNISTDVEVTTLLNLSKRKGIYLNDYLVEALKVEHNNIAKEEWNAVCEHLDKVIKDRCKYSNHNYFPFQFDLFYHAGAIFIYQIEHSSRYLVFVCKLNETMNSNLINLLNKRVKKLEKKAIKSR